jgi:hypothetical protein
LDSADGRARRNDITLTLDCDSALRISARPQILGLLVRSLVDQAISSTPRSSSVEIKAVARTLEGATSISIHVVDGGPIVPEGTQEALLLGQADPSAIGRPSALAWTTAGAAAATLGVSVEVGESPDHRSEVRLTVPA